VYKISVNNIFGRIISLLIGSFPLSCFWITSLYFLPSFKLDSNSVIFCCLCLVVLLFI